jgi:hypothetical protein
MKFPGRISRCWIQFKTVRQGNRTEGTEEPYSSTHAFPHLAEIDTGIGSRYIKPLTIHITPVIKPEHTEPFGKRVLEFQIK